MFRLVEFHTNSSDYSLRLTGYNSEHKHRLSLALCTRNTREKYIRDDMLSIDWHIHLQSFFLNTFYTNHCENSFFYQSSKIYQWKFPTHSQKYTQTRGTTKKQAVIVWKTWIKKKSQKSMTSANHSEKITLSNISSINSTFSWPYIYPRREFVCQQTWYFFSKYFQKC